MKIIKFLNKTINIVKRIGFGKILLALILLGLIISTINPILFTSGVAKENGYKAINTKIDFFKPTITYLLNSNPCPKERSDVLDFEYIILHPDRMWYGLFESKSNILGIAKCTDLDEFLELVKTKDLSIEGQNPNPDKFRNGKTKTSLQREFEVPEEERYYNAGRSSNVHKENIEDFKKLKKGMNWKEMYDTIGTPDIGFGSGGVSNSRGEVTFVVNKNGIKFFAVGADQYLDDSPTAKLLSLWQVDYDNKATEIPLETLR
jgi:hypothetical protein